MYLEWMGVIAARHVAAAMKNSDTSAYPEHPCLADLTPTILLLTFAFALFLSSQAADLLLLLRRTCHLTRSHARSLPHHSRSSPLRFTPRIWLTSQHLLYTLTKPFRTCCSHTLSACFLLHNSGSASSTMIALYISQNIHQH